LPQKEQEMPPMPVVAPIVPECEPIEEVIGDAIAACALTMLEGARICIANGGQLSPQLTKRYSKAGGAYIAQLYELCQATQDELDFDTVAREWGAKALRKRFNGHGYPAVAGDTLVNDVITAVRQVTMLMDTMAEADRTPLSS
jgi:hypothetical protein